jgi:hypothetical protein
MADRKDYSVEDWPVVWIKWTIDEEAPGS